MANLVSPRLEMIEPKQSIHHRTRNVSLVCQLIGYGVQAESGNHMSVDIPAGGAILKGDLHIPAEPLGAVLFAHGSGSNRHSPRNQFVARALLESGQATLLLDLLTETEKQFDQKSNLLRFDVNLLADRLLHAAAWILKARRFRRMKLGVFGASTGAAAALIAAAKTSEIAAVVSRGGRPDLAGPHLDNVTVPVLLIVGGNDLQVLELNREAATRIRGEKKLEVIRGATHLFEEPGALEKVAEIAGGWFNRYLAGSNKL